MAPPGCAGGPALEAADGELTVCPDGTPPRDRAADRVINDALFGGGIADHHRAAYDIGCDEGGWTDFVRKLWCGAQALPFALGKWAIGLAIGVMDWALEFRIAEALTPIAGMLSRVYDASLIGPLGIRHLAWTVALMVGGWHLLRARAARGASEVAATFVIAVVGGILLANPDGYLDGSVELARNTSGAVLEATDGAMRGEGEERELVGAVLDRSFVAEPYDLINWGRPLDGDCAAARDEILDSGPWGNSGDPRDMMRDAGCDAEADFNERPTDERAAASLVVAFAAIATAVLLVLVALGVFIAQLTLVFIFGAASIVWVVALFPGARGALWWWISKLASSVLTAVAATFLLSWLAVSITAVLNVTEDLSVLQRCFIVLLVVAFAWRIRSQLSRISEALRHRLGDQLSRLAPSELTRSRQHNRWPALAASGTSGGLRGTARDFAQDVPGGQLAMDYAYFRLLTGSRGGGYGRRGPRQGLVRGVGSHLWGMARATPGDVRATGRALRTAAMAPVLAPQAYISAHPRVTDKSRRVRERLTQARDTRGKWAHNVRHPVNAMVGAHEQARTQAGLPPEGRVRRWWANVRSRRQQAPAPPTAQLALPAGQRRPLALPAGRPTTPMLTQRASGGPYPTPPARPSSPFPMPPASPPGRRRPIAPGAGAGRGRPGRGERSTASAYRADRIRPLPGTGWSPQAPRRTQPPPRPRGDRKRGDGKGGDRR